MKQIYFPANDFVPLHKVFKEPQPLEVFAAEACLFSATPEFVRTRGGPLARKILSSVNFNSQEILQAVDADLYPVIDFRVHRLMPGMFPSIPGWHCDAVPRKDYKSQPDFSLLNSASVHFTCVVGTDEKSSMTEYVKDSVTIPIDNESPVWKQVHIATEKLKPSTGYVEHGRLYRFSSKGIHRATAATVRGWRAFFRLSYYHNPPIVNGIPSQQQVYILSEENGW